MWRHSKHAGATMVAATLLAAACQDRPLTAPTIGGPQLAVSDGAHSGGNADFFFLPPLVGNPSSDPNFEKGDFNPNLRPRVRVCRLSDPDAVGQRDCVPGGDVALPPGGFLQQPAPLVPGEEHYKYEWDTGASNLDPTRMYRIFAVIGGRDIGFVDVQPVTKGMKNPKTGDVFEFQDGRTVPVKMRFENDALCDDPGGTVPCTSKTIDLGEGGFVVLEQTGDRVDVPAQPDRAGQEITLTLQLCDGIPFDLPTFGNCLKVTDDPPLEGRLTNRATVSMCSLDPPADLAALSPSQQDLLKMYRFDQGPPEKLEALPEASDFCETIGSTGPNGLRVLAHAGWRGLLAGLGRLFAPRPLHASLVVIDVGDAGSTEVFSFFQFALPAKMVIAAGDGQTGAPNSAVPTAPSVFVSDLYDAPVANARVHFEITSEGGGSVTPMEVLTNGDGLATVTNWFLGEPGTHTLRAFGRGIADPQNNGPRTGEAEEGDDFFDPFMPDITLPLPSDEACVPGVACQVAVPVGTGEVIFTAEAISGLRISGFTSPRTPFPLVDPSGEPLSSTGSLFAALTDATNFGPGGIVSCAADFRPFVTVIASGALVNPSGNRLVDVFFAGPTTTTLTPDEAAELAAFLDAGGILYLSGDTDDNDGPSYNPLFSVFDVADRFTANFLRSDQSSGQSSDPPDNTPITNGPFGAVGPLEHTGYREFSAASTTALATGNNPEFPFTLLAEGAFGAGRLSVTGDPIYLNFMFEDPDNRRYFLNLFALGCQ